MGMCKLSGKLGHFVEFVTQARLSQWRNHNVPTESVLPVWA